MKVTFVCDEYPPKPHGGIGTFVSTLAPALVSAGHQVTVVGFDRLESERNENGLRLVTLQRSSTRGVRWLLDRYRLHRWLTHEYAARNMDLVEVPDYQGWLPIGSSAYPVAVRLHLSLSSIHQRRGSAPPQLVYLLEKATLKMHPCWIAVSEFALVLTRHTFGLEPRGVEVIGCPIAVDSESVSSSPFPGQRYILFAGSVSVRKGAIALADGIRNLLSRDPRLHLVYIGPLCGEEGVDIKKEIAEITRPNGDRVHFLGRQPRTTVLRFMKHASAFVFLSTLETFGLVVAEAMLTGTLVVAPNCPPFTEYVQHGVTGCLVDPGNRDELQHTIESLLATPDRYSDIRTRAQQYIAHRYSVEECMKATLAVYSQLLASRGA